MLKRPRIFGALLLPLLALLPLREAALPAASPAPAYVALTFDDSPNAALTARLLDGLAARGAHATFFVIGSQAEGQEDLLRRMAAEGHQVGNHTWTHRRLDTSGAVGLRELARTDALLRGVLGEGDYWVRPPWGFASQATLRSVSVPLIHWSVDTEDWRVLDADAVSSALIDAVQDGDIVLLHDSYAASVDAALRAIDALQGRGFVFVTVAELFARMGVTPAPGVFYCRPDRERPVA